MGCKVALALETELQTKAGGALELIMQKCSCVGANSAEWIPFNQQGNSPAPTFRFIMIAGVSANLCKKVIASVHEFARINYTAQ